MKKADRLAKAISAVLFAAMLCYIGFAVARRIAWPVRTALAVETALTDAVSLQGIVVRSETLLTTNRDYVDISAAEGEKIAAGGTVATVYTSEQALDRALRLANLERELQAAEEALAEPAALSGGVWSGLEEIARSLHRGSLGSLDLQAEQLAVRLGQGAETELSAEYLYELRRERDELRQTVDQEAQSITAPAAGSFSSVLDGYEDLDPAAAGALTPGALQALLEESRTGDKQAFGKLVESPCWYYAALVDEKTAAGLAAGQAFCLRFGRYCGEDLPARLLQLSAAEDGRCVALFELDRALTELLPARKCSAELVFGGHSGLRCPREGLWRYYAGYVTGAEAEGLRPGDSFYLVSGSWMQAVTLSEIGEENAAGLCQLILYWPWSEDNAGPAEDGQSRLVLPEGGELALQDHYPAGQEHLCVFTMTGRQAERKKVTLVYGGEEFCLLASEGEDALRAGNEIIVEARSLYDGRVFD